MKVGKRFTLSILPQFLSSNVRISFELRRQGDTKPQKGNSREIGF